jgi:hypothetical protein
MMMMIFHIRLEENFHQKDQLNLKGQLHKLLPKICIAKRRIKPRLTPWKLLFLMNSYKFILSKLNVIHK